MLNITYNFALILYDLYYLKQIDEFHKNIGHQYESCLSVVLFYHL